MNSSSGLDQSFMRPPLRWASRVLALAALSLSVYLAWTSSGHSTVAGCGGMGQVDCDAVLGSRWSLWLGIPVAIGGLVCYAVFFLLSLLLGWRHPKIGRWVGTLTVMFAVIAAGAGLWFTVLQFAVIQKVCPYCLGIHGCGLILAGLVFWSVLVNKPGVRRESVVQRLALGSVLRRSGQAGHVATQPPLTDAPSLPFAITGAAIVLTVLICGQILFPTKTYEVQQMELQQSFQMASAATAPTTEHATQSSNTTEDVVQLSTDDEPHEKDDVDNRQASSTNIPTIGKESNPQPQERLVTFLNGTLTINTYDHALLGSPEAPYVVVELMDYTCPVCRTMYNYLKTARHSYGDELAIVVMPVPLELACNKYVRKTQATHRGACKTAKLALAISDVDPAAFPGFHHWLLADEKKIRPLDEAILHGFRIVDPSRLRELTRGQEMSQRIQSYVELYGSLVKRYQDSENGYRQESRKGLGLPVLIFGDEVMSGKPDNAEQLVQIWEEKLGIQPR